MVVSLNYCSQNGGNLYRAPYYDGNPNIGPRIIRNLDQYPYACIHLASPSLEFLTSPGSKYLVHQKEGRDFECTPHDTPGPARASWHLLRSTKLMSVGTSKEWRSRMQG